ncbi:HORMA domain-containing protein 1 isoform X1 [Pundamilia nyererei]|uniref:HORMA domain-containing protein 1 isoform X1 n=3 Tax=Pundamilia nyererei TaxID=303518 RepID=A0A9Y3VPW2_9CICH|nr:PREDICTED: HORMA domain-containing protein 1 isoform X1 [Pundamilia nyererei]
MKLQSEDGGDAGAALHQHKSPQKHIWGMACAQQVRTSQSTQLFPNQIASEQQSLVVMKKLLAIAVSGITYLRGIFPGKAYGKKYVEDQQVMILREEHSCPGATQILQWMQGCFDAIEKKYLRTVIISIYTDPENPQKVTEFYHFRIQYSAAGAHMDFESNNNIKVSSMSCGNTRKAIILLVRKLYTVMQYLGPLPENVYLNMKLAYYDDVTPQAYQPPGFREADCDTMEFEQEPVKLTMGEVVSPYHTLKLDMATERHRLEQVEEKWVLKIDEEDAQSEDPKCVEEAQKENIILENTEVQVSCHEEISTCEEVTEMDTLVKKTSYMEVGTKRTRSGRIIKPTMASQFPTSQETPSTDLPTKKRKFSEPKERY